MSQNVKYPERSSGPSKVQQHFKEDSDINNIVARHMRGVGRNLSNIGNVGVPRQPMFGDFSSSMHYHDMLNAVTDMDNKFHRLPARLRGRFGNTPYQLLRWLEDPENHKEAIKLGLMLPPEGMVMTESGDLVEQTDIVNEAVKAPPEPPPAPKADEEANPSFPAKGKK